MKKKKISFTLSEVLITLVVIGIIAAVTVPVVMANHKKTETAAKLKKFYSTMSEAVKLSEMEHGMKSYEWNHPNTCYDYDLTKEYYFEYILPYIVYLDMKKLSDTEYYNKMDFKWKELSENSPIVYLNDGSLFFIDECYDTLLYDVNGERGPNKSGRDMFAFFIVSVSDGDELVSNPLPHFNTLRPYDYGDTTTVSSPEREQAKQHCTGDDTALCAYLIQLDGWEFKDDYPIKL